MLLPAFYGRRAIVNLSGLVVNFSTAVFILVFLGLITAFFFLGRKRSSRGLREIPAFNRIKRSVGLSVEAGNRVHFSLGRGGISELPAGIGMVGLTMLDRIARAASSSDRPPVASSGEGALGILSQDVLRNAYRSINVEGQYDPGAGRLTGVTPFSYATGAIMTVKDEQVSTNILVGNFGSEVALIAEAGEQSGSLTVGGSDHLATQAVLYAMTQEPLVGEEAYAGGAYLGGGPAHIASLRAQDILRWVIAAVIILGALAKLVGIL
jgi:hypothetical protein